MDLFGGFSGAFGKLQQGKPLKKEIKLHKKGVLFA